jgi:O-antigen/teichoic acid export membrane protein
LSRPSRLARIRRNPASKATAGALASAITSQVLTAISGILAARALGVEDRGYLALLILVPLIATHLGLIVPVATTYYVARAPQLAGDIVRRLLTPAVVQLAVLGGAHVGALVLIIPGLESDAQTAALWTLPAVPLLLLQQYGLAVLQGRQAFRAFNVLRIGPAAMYTAATCVLIVLGAGTLVGFTVAWIVATGVSAIVTIGTALRTLPPATASSEVPTTRAMLGFGGRSFLGTASPVEYFQVDQAVAGLFLSVPALGLYVTAVAVTNVVRLIGQSVGMVAFPRVAAHHGADQIRTLRRFFAVTAALSGTAVIVLELTCGWFIPLLFGEDFAGAVPICRILLIAAFLFSLRRVLTDAARGAGFATAGSVAEALSWAVFATGAAVLVGPLGPEGVAAALAAAGAASLGLLCLVVLTPRARKRGGDVPA